MMIPIASMTVVEMREEFARRIGDDRYNFGKRLIDEIARLRDLEVVVCHTRWHDHAPQDLTIEPEPAVQLELIELTRLMAGDKNGK